MEAICPLCNGLMSVTSRCPVCGATLADGGQVSDYAGPYSPYMETEAAGRQREGQDTCLHLVFCRQCGWDRRVLIRRTKSLSMNKDHPERSCYNKKAVTMMSNPLVSCSVDQCTHNMAGKQCVAATISIYNDEASGKSSTAEQTQCKSFHPRKSVGDMIGAFHNANVGGAMTAAFMDGTQITPSVECFVNHCTYWDEENVCQAESITVSGSHAARTADTDCSTFRAR